MERLSKYGTTGVPDGTILPPLEDWTIRPRELGGASSWGTVQKVLGTVKTRSCWSCVEKQPLR